MIMWLWFAWKIVLLQYHKHHTDRGYSRLVRCDLLEKSYFCSITNIATGGATGSALVVICLKNRTFAVSQTSILFFRICLTSCDLLEKSYFCSITNILSSSLLASTELWFAWKIVLLQYHKHHRVAVVNLLDVVICLKNRTFAVSQTSAAYMLDLGDGCDLLEKSYFCSITNITGAKAGAQAQVVICLKNRTFAVSQTSLSKNKTPW